MTQATGKFISADGHVDRPGLLTCHLPGVDRVLWGSDCPHPEGTFPHSCERIAKDFADIPADETRLIVGGNARRLYGIEAN